MMNPFELKPIFDPTSPAPAGHYSPAIVYQGVAYLSGQLPRTTGPAGPFVPATIEEQTRLVLANVDKILLAAGSHRQHVIKSTIYLSDISHWTPVNQIYSEFFGDHKPARSIIPAGKFRDGILIEIDMIAAVRNGTPPA